MDYVTYAIPFFLLAVLLEAVWGARKKRQTYRINDTINSLSMGLIRNISYLLSLGVGAALFTDIEERWSLLPQWNMNSPWAWITGLVAYDFCYYWFHRIAHERQIFWASHVAHHQSEEYNLSTALRQTGTGFLLGWVFFLPLFFLGMPVYLYVSVASINLIYQFWVHTRFIPKLGWYEWFFITPSNHRVHHAQNSEYVDRNYGGMFILWDRLFGTFAEERDDIEIAYGISTPLHSWNPLWANLHIYAWMLADSWRAKSWRDKLHVWVARTGWRPIDAAAQFPHPKSDLAHFQKYNPELGTRAKYCLLSYFLMAAGIQIWFETVANSFAPEARWAMAGMLIYNLAVLGAALDRRPYAIWLERLRWLLAAGLLLQAYSAATLVPLVVTLLWAGLLASGVLMIIALRTIPIAVRGQSAAAS